MGYGVNKENASKLWKIIQEAGDYLRGQLPDTPQSPKRAQPLCACCNMCERDILKTSYKDIPDEKFDEVVEYIEFLKQNPN
jgi:hypothetical protein